MSRIFDISLTLSSNLPVWEGDPRIYIERVSRIEDGCDSNVTELRMRVHSGTHVDAPYHFIHGARTVDQLSLDALIGPAQVIEISDDVELITEKILETLEFLPGVHRILFKTKNSSFWRKEIGDFNKGFVALDEHASRALVKRDINLVGIDYLSVAPFDNGVPTHKILLSAGIIVLEGVNLSEVPGGLYWLYCLPLKILGADGAPARVILVGD